MRDAPATSGHCSIGLGTGRLNVRRARHPLFKSNPAPARCHSKSIAEDRPMVRARPTSDRGSPLGGEFDEPFAPTSPPQPPAAADSTRIGSSSKIEKCMRCQFYDRRRERSRDGDGLMWGQCRRHSPLLNPLSTKAYMVEGVWPLVRDDDWCGEWRVVPYRAEEPLPQTVALMTEEARPGPLRPRSTPAAAPATATAGGSAIVAGDD